MVSAEAPLVSAEHFLVSGASALHSGNPALPSGKSLQPGAMPALARKSWAPEAAAMPPVRKTTVHGLGAHTIRTTGLAMTRRREITKTLALASACWLGLSTAALADFTVNSWRLVAGIIDEQSGGPTEQNTSVANPFSGSLNASHSNSLAQAAYQFNWDLATGQFNNTAHVEAQGGPSFLAGVDNLVRITPTTDVLLSVDAEWDFHLGGGDRSSFLFVQVGQNGSPLLMNWNYGSSPIFGGPSSAVWTIHDSVILPAGGSYFFRSIFRFDSFSGSPTVLSTGTGFANFSLTTVPSPATLAPMALATLLIRKRRRI